MHQIQFQGCVQGEGHACDRDVREGDEDAALTLARPLTQRKHTHIAPPPLQGH